MAEIPSRELRNDTRQVLARVSAGESITITIDGRRVAELTPASERRRWMPRDEFIGYLRTDQADPALLDELRLLNPDTTDDLA
ncbi:MAG: type II toxin-antitoxin system prevent-host-death family antitoxin [Acidimicrobiales bacterium]